jgi:alpha-glucosidase (family GH31 glycosyl hydrolase)
MPALVKGLLAAAALVVLAPTGCADPISTLQKPSAAPWPELLPYNPVAAESAITTAGNARFTVLTDRLIRMEYSANAVWEDKATTAMLNRNLPVPKYSHTETDGVLRISTDYLTLSWTVGTEFSADTLSIVSNAGVKSAFEKWSYGDANPENLLGTIKSLDQLPATTLNCSLNANITVHDEDLHCAWGLISRAGWSVVDDSDTYVLNPATGWWDLGQNSDDIDLYMFAHGHDYKAALKDFVLVSGKTAMAPRAASGLWWTRWFNLNTEDLIEIVKGYEQNSMPLDTFVLDMDWHTKEEWGGYTWDRHLFPFPADAMGYLKSKGLVTLANIHDDDGVASFESEFDAMAKAMGVDPRTTKKIPFAICENSTYAEALEDLVLKPREDDGLDYWWIDWQQGGKQGGCAGLKQNPTIWTNKIRATDHIRRGSTKRGMVLARWGGLGSHRYQVGFSGDVLGVDWKNLAYQPYFSLTATNVAYGFWSHDIVGPSQGDNELYVRWIQWATYSGVFRSHDRGSSGGDCAKAFPSTDENNQCTVVRPWNVPLKYLEANRASLRRRRAMVPYFYNLVRDAFDSGLGPLRPMYYEFPEENNAYLADLNGNFAQYFFGDDMIVAPVVTPADPNTTNLASKKIWIPAGEWVEKDRGTVIEGPQMLSRLYTLAEIPVFVKMGAMIPTLPFDRSDSIGVASRAYSSLIWTVYLGSASASPIHGEGHVYEDDGATTAYLQPGGSTVTKASFSSDASTLNFVVNSSTEKAYSLVAVNGLVPSAVHYGSLVASTSIPYSRFEAPGAWTYDGQTGEVKVNVPGEHKSLKIVVTWAKGMSAKSASGSHPSSGLRGVLTLAGLARHTLNQVRKTPGETHVGGGKLDAIAGTGQVLSYLAGKNDVPAFMAALNGVQLALNEAIEEVKTSVDLSSYGDDGVRRLAYVNALMEEAANALM